MDYLNFLKGMPRALKPLTKIPGIWLVGSSASIEKGTLDLSSDIDLIVEPKSWHLVTPFLAAMGKREENLISLTSFGGIRINYRILCFKEIYSTAELVSEFILNIWLEDISSYLLADGFEKAVIHLSTGQALISKSCNYN